MQYSQLSIDDNKLRKQVKKTYSNEKVGGGVGIGGIDGVKKVSSWEKKNETKILSFGSVTFTR